MLSKLFTPWCGARISLRQVPAPSRKLKHPLYALTLFAALAAMHAAPLRAQSWQYTNGPYSNSGKKVSDVIAFAKSNDALLFAATDTDGVFSTSDAGDHWQQYWYSPGNKVNCIAAKGSFVLIGTTKGLVRSTDGGATFDSAVDVFYRPDVLELVHDTAGIFYTVAGFSAGGSGSNILSFRSSDGGATWDTLTSFSGMVTQALVVDSSNALLLIGYPPPNDPQYVEVQIWKSLDGGVSWFRTQAPYYLENSFVYGAAANGNFYAYSNGMGLLRANDSTYGAWGPLFRPGLLLYARHFAFFEGGTMCMATEDGLDFSFDGGNSWNNISAPLNDFPSCEYAFGGDLFASSESGVIRVSAGMLSVALATQIQSSPALMYCYPRELLLTLDKPSSFQIDFYDAAGRWVAASEYPEISGGRTIVPIPTALRTGFYFAHCQTGSGFQSCKFVVTP